MLGITLLPLRMTQVSGQYSGDHYSLRRYSSPMEEFAYCSKFLLSRNLSSQGREQSLTLHYAVPVGYHPSRLMLPS